MICSCGFIIVCDSRILLCHPTNAGFRWDIPKGIAEENEDHLDAAKRELLEETGVSFNGDIIDLGCHQYQKNKNLHLFYMKVDNIPIKEMECKSMVKNKNGPDFPEMDDYKRCSFDKIESHVGKSLWKWISVNVPKELLK